MDGGFIWIYKKYMDVDGSLTYALIVHIVK